MDDEEILERIAKAWREVPHSPEAAGRIRRYGTDYLRSLLGLLDEVGRLIDERKRQV